MSLEGSIRKRRLTQKEIQDFATWAIINNVYEKYTCGRIRQIYLEEKGIDLTVCSIKNQKDRWVLIDGKLYDKNKPWTFNNKKDNGN